MLVKIIFTGLKGVIIGWFQENLDLQNVCNKYILVCEDRKLHCATEGINRLFYKLFYIEFFMFTSWITTTYTAICPLNFINHLNNIVHKIL